ncbi:MAG: hypothetical protein WAqPseu_42580 [Shewanella algae]|jgi:hypothetical protein|uniref:Uncharacterized protein n=1 Tax=Shewanella algae TaxID=38313 RepID=A0A380AB92_9GAMM|nr:Uncharacterised protein [Shewanella algae]
MLQVTLYLVGSLSAFVLVYYLFLNLVLASEESRLLDPKDK